MIAGIDIEVKNRKPPDTFVSIRGLENFGFHLGAYDAAIVETFSSFGLYSEFLDRVDTTAS